MAPRPARALDARAALLARLIDHAPQFPPASLGLAAAVAEDQRARASRHAFLLARYVCPASRLSELPDVGRGVSVVLDAPLEQEPRVEAVETERQDGLEEVSGLAPEVYVELPLDGALTERLERLASLGLRAKVRCGGASVPSVGELASFVRACRVRGLAFKATAGLHHAIRTRDEHGLLNLLAAVAFGDEERALEEEDAEAFRLGPEAFRWRKRALAPAALVDARRLLVAVGSCSFFEPVEELESLGMLPS